MRTLSRNERLLAIALGAAVFLVLNLAGMRWIATQLRTLKGEIATQRTEAAAARELLKQRPYYVAREKWLEAHPLPAYDERLSQSEFVQGINASVQTNKLKILSQVPSEPEFAGPLAVAKIDLTINGRLEAIVRWLHAIQQPGKFMFTEKFALKQGDDGNSMELQILLGKVYRVGGSATSP